MFNYSDKSILVTDDSAIMRMFLVLNLKRMLKINIAEAVNGLDALAKIKTTKFDLLLTDMNMPEMNGAELVRWVRTGLKSDMPIIVITTMGEVKDRDFSRADFTSKGFFVKLRMKFDQLSASEAVKWFVGL